MDFTKHSVSTKIADSLASGIPLIAYGPAEISSMAHLIRHECAVTAVSQEALRDMLERALREPKVREHVVQKALQVASEYHDLARNGDEVRSLFQKIVETEIG